jgi:predicted acylesterase/phospholipase RssA
MMALEKAAARGRRCSQLSTGHHSSKLPCFCRIRYAELQVGRIEERFQILALDGGGIRGLFSAAILALIERDLGTKVVDHFDLIVGTSTGGIVAIGLGLGLEPRQLVDFYLRHCPEIFKNRLHMRSVLQWFRRKYSSEGLSSALKEALSDRLFGESSKRLVIPAYNLGDDDVYLFRTPHHQRLRRDYRTPAWQVAVATSAAPTFFPACGEVDHLRLVDGGIWANNPAMVGLVEAVGTLGVNIGSIKMLSIGTYDSVQSRPSRLDRGGKIAWARGAAVVDVLMRAQSIGINNQVRFLVGSERFVRIDPRVPAADISLDLPCKVDDLLAKAAHHSRIFMPQIEKTFFDHKAKPYHPLYAVKENRDG